MTKLIQKNNFWYLHHSYKKNNKTETIEKYLGKEIPKNILIIQKRFEEEVFKKRFEKEINNILKEFNEEFKTYNKIAKKKYFSQFAIKFTYNSQAIEGSTLNLKDTALLIEQGITPQKKFEDIQLSKTHYDVFTEILNLNKNLSAKLILEFHKKLFKQTYPEISGKYRTHPVKVVGSKAIFTHQNNIKTEIKEFILWYERNKDKIHPIRLAALVHLKFVSIHPFTDGNGRMSRLLMNYILHINKYPLIDIDYKKRNSYYNSLEKDQVNGTQHIFVNYLAKKFIKNYKK